MKDCLKKKSDKQLFNIYLLSIRYCKMAKDASITPFYCCLVKKKPLVQFISIFLFFTLNCFTEILSWFIMSCKAKKIKLIKRKKKILLYDYFRCNETLSCKSTEDVIRMLLLRTVHVHVVWFIH